MKSRDLAILAAHVVAASASASLTQSSGLGTTHAGNLVANGSFEIGAPADGIANAVNWTDPFSSPYAVPPAWTSSGPGSSTLWGNDGPTPYRLKSSDVLPDGRAGLFMRTVTGAIVTQPPTFNPNGSVSFPSTPTFINSAGAPVVLSQSVPTHLTPAPSYKMSFWVSGEENSTNQGFTGTGIIGMRMTNVLAGNPTQWLAVPNAINYGQSILYEFVFTPLNPLLPVNIDFINPGGMNLSMYGGTPFGTQPILDDVIINAVPGPGVLGLLIVAPMFRRRTRF